MMKMTRRRVRCVISEDFSTTRFARADGGFSRSWTTAVTITFGVRPDASRWAAKIKVNTPYPRFVLLGHLRRFRGRPSGVAPTEPAPRRAASRTMLAR